MYEIAMAPTSMPLIETIWQVRLGKLASLKSEPPVALDNICRACGPAIPKQFQSSVTLLISTSYPSEFSINQLNKQINFVLLQAKLFQSNICSHLNILLIFTLSN